METPGCEPCLGWLAIMRDTFEAADTVSAELSLLLPPLCWYPGIKLKP